MQRFKDMCAALFLNGCVFADWEGCNKGLYTHIVMKQLSLKRKFWVNERSHTHFDPGDPENKKSAADALESIKVSVAGLFGLIDAGLDLKFLENCFRCFHLERWTDILRYTARHSSASSSQKTWAQETKQEFERCYDLICKARSWARCWLAFQRAVEYCVEEWQKCRPSDYTDLESHTDGSNKEKIDSDVLHLDCWKNGFARAVAEVESLESERPKVIWYLNLCSTGTAGNERILKKVNSVWKTKTTFLSRQSLEDSVLLKCGCHKLDQWVTTDSSNVDRTAVVKDVKLALRQKVKMFPTKKLKRADRCWRRTFGERYVLHRKNGENQVKFSNKQKISKHNVKAEQLVVVRKIMAKYMQRKREQKLKAMRKEPSIFGVPMKQFMSDESDVSTYLRKCPEIEATVDSFVKRYKFKEKEQRDRAAGQNAYDAELKKTEKARQNLLEKHVGTEGARMKSNTINENKFFKLKPDHPSCADIPSEVGEHWTEAVLLRNAHVIIVKDLDFAVPPKNSQLNIDELAIAMLCGQRIALPEYLQPNRNKDHFNTSIKFVGAMHRERGIVIGEEFARKHRYFTQVIRKVCTVDKGWQAIASDDEAAWTAAGKKVGHINTTAQFIDLLKLDSHHDRKRSAKGQYQKH
jgi:hypothetical protein